MKKLIFTVIIISLLFLSNLNALWVFTNGPYGAAVQSLISKGTYMFAGTGGGGVYVSTNNGAVWTPSNSGLGATNIYS